MPKGNAIKVTRVAPTPFYKNTAFLAETGEFFSRRFEAKIFLPLFLDNLKKKRKSTEVKTLRIFLFSKFLAHDNDFPAF